MYATNCKFKWLNLLLTQRTREKQCSVISIISGCFYVLFLCVAGRWAHKSRASGHYREEASYFFTLRATAFAQPKRSSSFSLHSFAVCFFFRLIFDVVVDNIFWRFVQHYFIHCIGVAELSVWYGYECECVCFCCYWNCLLLCSIKTSYVSSHFGLLFSFLLFAAVAAAAAYFLIFHKDVLFLREYKFWPGVLVRLFDFFFLPISSLTSNIFLVWYLSLLPLPPPTPNSIILFLLFCLS